MKTLLTFISCLIGLYSVAQVPPPFLRHGFTTNVPNANQFSGNAIKNGVLTTNLTDAATITSAALNTVSVVTTDIEAGGSFSLGAFSDGILNVNGNTVSLVTIGSGLSYSGTTLSVGTGTTNGFVRVQSGTANNLTITNIALPLSSNPSNFTWVAAFEANRLPVIADGTALSTFTDFSGNGRDATQSGATRPAYKVAANGINNQPVIRFSGSQYMRTVTGGQALTNDFYMAAVVKLSSLTGYGTVLATGDELTGRRREILKDIGTGVFTFNGFNADVSGTPSVSTGTPVFIEVTKRATTVTILLNGTNAAYGYPALVIFTNNVLTLGANNASTGGETFIGDMALALFASGQPDSATLYAVRYYVQATYGVSISTSTNTPLLKRTSLGTVSDSGLTDDANRLYAPDRQLYVVGNGANNEHVLKGSWSGNGLGANVLKLQQLNPSGYSVVYAVSYDTVDGTEGKGWAGGYGNVSATAPFGGVAFTEAYNNSGSFIPFRLIQTTTAGSFRRMELDDGGGINLFKNDNVYPNESVLLKITNSVFYFLGSGSWISSNAAPFALQVSPTALILATSWTNTYLQRITVTVDGTLNMAVGGSSVVTLTNLTTSESHVIAGSTVSIAGVTYFSYPYEMSTNEVIQIISANTGTATATLTQTTVKRK